MINHNQLMSLKDQFARAWNFCNAVSYGAVPSAVHVTPEGKTYRGTESALGSIGGEYAFIVGGGEVAEILKPGKEYVLLRSDAFQDLDLAVMVDHEGQFHIVRDGIFRLIGQRLRTIEQIVAQANNHNLCRDVTLRRNLRGQAREESITLAAGMMETDEVGQIGFSFIGQKVRFNQDNLDGVTMVDELDRTVLDYARVPGLSFSSGGAVFTDRVNPEIPNGWEIGILAAISLAQGRDPSDIELGFEIMETMSSNVDELYFSFNGCLIVNDRTNNESMVVPDGQILTLLKSKTNPAKQLTVRNTHQGLVLLSNTL